ncbi:hypothetical protein CYLTODRAFT_419319, partial [Cylindrobasidium torrendii FP15055 ss-10]
RRLKRQIYSSDSEDEEVRLSVPPSPKRPKFEKTATNSAGLGSDEEDLTPLSETPPPQPKASSSKGKKPTKKRRRAEYSDDDGEDDYDAGSAMVEIEEELQDLAGGGDEDGDYDTGSKRKRSSKVPPPAKKPSKPKGKVIMAKKPRITTPTDSDTGGTPAPPPMPMTMKIPKKTPAVKKAGGTPVPVPSNFSSGSTPVPQRAHMKNVPRTGDLDLNNGDVYKSLFTNKKDTPKSGIIQVNEKKAEIEKLREQARAQRLAQSTVFFNMQAETEKVMAHEESFKNRRSQVLFPNLLGSKFKTEYDRAQKQLAQQMQRNGASSPSKTEGAPGIVRPVNGAEGRG